MIEFTNKLIQIEEQLHELYLTSTGDSKLKFEKDLIENSKYLFFMATQSSDMDILTTCSLSRFKTVQEAVLNNKYVPKSAILNIMINSDHPDMIVKASEKFEARGVNVVNLSSLS